jgi:hypothetical protein
MRLLRALPILAVALALALPACRKPVPQPSAEYDQASLLFHQIYARDLDDAYGNPQVDEVVGLLKKVDPRSADAEAAQKLLKQIADGKQALAKARAEDERRRADQRAPAAPPPSAGSSWPPVAAPPSGPGQPQADAQQADGRAPSQAGTPGKPDPFGVGSSIAALNDSSGGCLQAGASFKESGSGKAGQMYKLSSAEACAAKLPGLTDQVLLVVDGKIYRRVSAKDVTMKTEAAPPPPPEAPKPPSDLKLVTPQAPPPPPPPGGEEQPPPMYGEQPHPSE